MQTHVKCSSKELEQASFDLKWLHEQSDDEAEAWITGWDVNAPAEALRGFAALQSLELTAVVVQARNNFPSPEQAANWHPIWAAASRSFRLVTSAIAISRVEINQLKLFSTTNRCSVTTFDIGHHMTRLTEHTFSHAAAKIKSFSLSMSTLVKTDCRKVKAASKSSERAQPSCPWIIANRD